MVDQSRARWGALALIAAAELLGMTLWFSASAVAPAVQRDWHLSASGAAWLTLAVQLGFVAGTLISAFTNLPDILNARYLMTLSALAGAAANASFGLFAEGPAVGIVLRFLTGLFLAGVYPPGMKVLATWFRHGRGLAIGVLVGALTLGKAFPYLINALDLPDWRTSVLLVSLLSAAGGLIPWLFVREGPYALPNARFDWRQVTRVFHSRPMRLANFGYFGHMWELYAMWTWAPVMLRASLGAEGFRPEVAEVVSFLVLGAGAVGCVLAGLWADRVGRTLVTSVAMVVSGACCLLVGFLFHGNPVLLIVVAVVWGAAVVADSAQFSTCITELGDPQYLGTALTIQTSIGFLLTTVSMRLIPVLVDHVGWEYAFTALAVGPALGVVAMLRLRVLPEATKIAHGRR